MKKVKNSNGMEILEELFGETRHVFAGCFKTLHEALEAEKEAEKKGVRE